MTDLPPPSYASVASPFPPQYEQVLSANNSAIRFTLNGQALTVDPATDPTITPNMTLVEYIRDKTKWTGTKVFCHEGGCGACVVSMTVTDPSTNQPVTKSVHSCLRPLFSCQGASITTNDGLAAASTGGSHPIQQALANHNGSQCGYCSNGMVMTMYALLASKPSLTALEIEQEFDGNLCRCTGYRPILDAMKTFATPTLHDDCDEDSCRKKGCKRQGIFPDIEEFSKFMEKHNHGPIPQPKPTLHKQALQSKGHSLKIQKNGSIWQDCPTLTDLNTWLPWYVAQGVDVMLVVAQTSLGVYPATPQVRLNIDPIPELHVITQNANGVTIGSAVTIGNVLNLFKTCQADKPYQTAHFAQAAKHFRRIASKPIRNVGSIFGNIAITAKHQLVSNFFCSDACTVLYGLGATFTMVDTVSNTTNVYKMDQIFTLDFTGKYCLSIFIPWALPNEFFMTYKIAKRQVNSHAIINAAMRVAVSPTTNTIEGTPVVVYGGIQTRQVRLPTVEAALVGTNITDLNAFQSVITALQSAINIPNGFPDAAFRKSISINYMYKYFLFLQKTLSTSLTTGAQCWMKRNLSSGTQAFQPNPAEYPVSIGIPKLESLQQTTGKAKYTQDLSPPVGMLHGALVLAKQANSTLDKIDATVASQMPGFVAFYDHTSIPAALNQWQNGDIFCTGPVQFYGQVVGVVVATSERYAFEAADTVVVTYKNINTPILTIDAAVAANNYYPSDLNPAAVTRGNATQAMTTAQKVLKGSVALGGQYHFHMENHVTRVVPREDVLEVHSATQMLPSVQMQCATISGYPMSKVNVTVKRCGGGFGGKISSSLQPAAIATFCATTLNAPVQVVVDLQQTTAMLGFRSEKKMNYQLGVNNDGTIVALIANVLCAAGSSFQDEIGAATVTIHSLDNAYYIPNADITAQMVNLNVPAAAPVRGPGWVPGIHLGETIISLIASGLNMDPMDVREKNFFTKGQTTCDGMILTYWNMPTIWSQLKESSTYTDRVTEVAAYNAANRWTKRGLAMTAVRFGVGQTGANFDSLVNIYADGTIGVTHGGSELGQGIDTKVIQVCAFKFGLKETDLHKITIHETSSRCLSAVSNVTGGSVTSELCALSVMHACETLNRRLAPLRQPNQTWAALIEAATQNGIELTAAGFSNAPINGSGIFNYNSNAAALNEVELDVLTGQYEVKRVDILFDCGISLNPTIDVGQVEGGFLFGMGMYVQETLEWDPNTGEPLCGSTWEYKVPSAYDVPEVLNTTLLRNAPNPLGVLGSKATGEPGVALGTGVLQALESAITAAREANGLGSQRWVCTQTPLTVQSIQAACGTTPGMFTL